MRSKKIQVIFPEKTEKLCNCIVARKLENQLNFLLVKYPLDFIILLCKD
jgi:hypothetical protein